MPRKNSIALELGSRIRNLRRQKSVTLIELSKITGVAQATLSRMETGLMIGTVRSHQKIAEALGISLGELYEGIDTRYERIKHQLASEVRKTLVKTDELKCELLTQEISKKKITPLMYTLGSHAKTDKERLDRGVEKFLLVPTLTLKWQFAAWNTLFFP